MEGGKGEREREREREGDRKMDEKRETDMGWGVREGWKG